MEYRGGDALLLLITFKYNVHSRTRWCGAPAFGHTELYFIDRIQNRVQEVYNILPWPRHHNLSFFSGKRDMISVGIGPLTYDDRYVIRSDKPDPCLKGDKWFIAKKKGG